MGVFLNLAFTVIEIIGGLWTNSLAILADALHDFGDSIVLITSLVLERQATRPPDAMRTFGYARLSLFSALFAALVLVGGTLFIISQTIPRLLNPEHVYAPGMMGLAVVGLLFNGVGYFRLKRGASMNEKVLSLHLLDDVMGWTVILIGSIIIQFWDNHIIDPLMTLGFSAFTLWGVVNNLKETVNIFLQGVPKGVSTELIARDVGLLPGVKAVHDIHVWSLDGETDILTGHVVVSDLLLENPDESRKKVKEVLKKHKIQHSTIELESERLCSGIECQV